MLRDLIYSVSEAAKTTAPDAASRARMLNYINMAAAEFYHSTDLPGSVCEQFFQTTETQQCISLPWYVGGLRAMRRHLSRTTVTIQDMTPRYAINPWRQPYDKPRMLRRAALHTPLSVESQLVVSIAQAQTVPFTVAITGQTPAAATITETLTFLAGELTKTTTAQFAKDDPIGVVAISKDNITTCDVVIEDGSGEEVAVIPNRLYTASNIILQINDDESGTMVNADNVIELLYKRPFVPYYYDTDTFCFPEFEIAIGFKARSYIYGLSKDQESVQQALLASQKADKLAADIISNFELQTADEIFVAANPFERAYLKSYMPYGSMSDSNVGYLIA